MRRASRTGAGAATLALLLLGAVICRCPLPMTPASGDHAHGHDCCPEEPSVRAVGDDCCANLPESVTAVVKNDQEVLGLAVAAFELDPAPTREVRSDWTVQLPLPSVSPPLVLRI